MKNNLLASTVLFGALAAAAIGAPLTETTAVHTKPDAASPTITYFKAGTEPTATPDSLANTPAGWMAVQLPGPFQGYVPTKDLSKQLDVIPGTPIRLTPDENGPVLTISAAADKTTITGLRGRWTQISLNKPLVGYIHVSATPGATPLATTVPGAIEQEPATAPAAPTAAVPAAGSVAGQPAPQSTAADSAQLPRQLTGKFVSTHTLLRPHPQYDWELVDNDGRRFAYVDISKLLLTDRIEKFIGHFVVVFGAATPTADGKDIVIRVESLQLLLK